MRKRKILLTPLAKRALKTMRKNKPRDFTVTDVALGWCWSNKDSKGFTIEWGTKSAGFGTLTIWADGTTIHMDTEAMGTKFCQKVFARLVSEAKRR